MKKEDGKSTLATLVAIAVFLIIGGVIVAMLWDEPKKIKNTNTNTINTENVQGAENTTNIPNNNTIN